jgi:poly(hydroxyalkanoate) depolymerase family esterase
MDANFQRLMNEATRLTRSGQLGAATAAIHAALGLRSFTDRMPAGAADPDVIDIDARVVPDDTPAVDEPIRQPRRDEPSTPERFVAGHYANSAGRRDYKLYVPPGAGQRPLPLVVMLHGCGQDPNDFAVGTAMNEAARAQQCFVLYPAQSQRVNPKRCWNWFKPHHQQRGRGEPAVLAGMTRDVLQRHAIDPQRVYVAGLSAGGAMAAILGDAYPELYAAVGVHSGLAVGAASDLPSAFAAMKDGGTRVARAASGMPTIVFHGDADTRVHPSNGEQLIAASVGTASVVETECLQRPGNHHRCTRRIYRGPDGRVIAEHWLVHGASHAWSGGNTRGSHTDARGPDATAEMLRFFLERPRRSERR